MVFAFVANVSAQLKVDANGQVGIGTASPQYKLDVTGNSRFAGNIYLGGYTNFIGMPTDVSLSFKVNGTLAGYTGSSDDYNVSFGYNAFSSNIIGDFNTAFGYEALVYNWMGGGNTANGAGALILNETGDGNTANGYITLILNETGSYNTAVGYEANVSSYDISNATAIGAEAYATSSDQVVIGNENVTSIGGYAAWSNFSDKRAKKNIRADVPGLNFINRLQPVLN